MYAVTRDIDAIGDQLAELAAHIHAGTARFLELLADFDARAGWAGWGIRSCAHWLVWRCGLSPGTAREHVRVARALRTLPAIAREFSAGRLSYSKVRAITRIARPDTENVLLEWALHGTAAQIERIVRGYRASEIRADASKQHASRMLDFYYDETGCLVIRARVAPEDGAVIMRALDKAAESLESDDRSGNVPAGTYVDTGEHDDDATEPHQQRRADALVMIAESFLASGPHQIAPEGRAVMLVHLGSERTGETNSGPPIPDATLRRLACDAGIIRVHEDGSIGRRSRAIPRALRRALIRRDRSCRFPACGARRADAHHIDHWADGGETSMRNLVLLCRTHHRLIHEKGFRVSARAPGEFEFFRPDGRHIEMPTTSGSVAQLRQVQGRTDIDPLTAASLGDVRRPDYGIAVSGLFALEHKT